MEAIYTTEPLQIQFLKKYDDKVLYILRKNITKSSITNSLINKTIDSWNCDEIQVETYYKDDIETDIKNNFDAYFALGEKEYQDKIDLENKKKQMEMLIDGNIFQQISINNQNDQSLQNIISTITEILDLLP